MKIIIVTGETVGLAEWIIDDTFLVPPLFLTLVVDFEKLGIIIVCKERRG